MTNTLQRLIATSFKFGKNGKGVLTSQEAFERSQFDGRSMVTIASHEDNVFFFSDDHIFGYEVLPNDFVPCSGGFPTTVVPRESIPDGKIDTIEKYIELFHSGERQITTIEELVEFIDNKNKDWSDAPMPVYENDTPSLPISNPDGTSNGVSLGQLLRDKARTIDEVQQPKIVEQKSKEINWQPEHFPAGTVVILGGYKLVDGELNSCNGGNAEVTVTSVVNNGGTSWLIRTDMTREHIGRVSLHFDHVTGIKSRGTGPVKIDKTRGDKPMINLKEGLSYKHLSKKKYFTNYLPELLNYLVATSSLPHHLYVKEGFFDFFMKQSFVNVTPGNWTKIYSFDKKKAKRFIHQNINRWIKPMKEVRIDEDAERKRECEAYYKDMEDEWDRDFDRDYPPLDSGFLEPAVE